VGSDLHFSQGMELTGWQVDDRRVSGQISLGRRMQGEFELALPAAPLAVESSGQPLNWRKTSNCYAFSILVDDQADFMVSW